MVKSYIPGTCKYCAYKNDEPFATLITNGADPKYIEMHCRMEAPDAAAEMGTATALAVLDGVAVPIHIFVISSDAQDAAAGTGATSVCVYGINGDDEYVIDTIVPTGAVQVEGAVLFKRVITAWVATTGTGLKAAGNISISNTGQTATYLIIPANSLYSNRMRFWVADGYKAALTRLYASYYQAEAAAAVDLDGGTNVWGIICEADEVPEVRANVPNHTIVPLTNVDILSHRKTITGSDESYFALYHSTVNTGANSIHDVVMVLCIWQDPTPHGRNL